MSKYQLGDWVVDLSKNLLINGKGETQVEPKCMELLDLLIQAKGELVTRKSIRESLWKGRYVSEHAVNNVVALLRKHLSNAGDKSYITTQPKRGYFLSQPVDILPINSEKTSVLPIEKRPQKNLVCANQRKPLIKLFIAVLFLLIAIWLVIKLTILAKPVSLVPNANEFFLTLYAQSKSSQSLSNEWQIGMYDGDDFMLFDYSDTTLLRRPAIVGWVKRGFHAGFLNVGEQDERFPGNVLRAGALALHPGDNSVETVLRYQAQLNGQYDVSVFFFAMDTIECLKCPSDGVNVSMRFNGNQIGESQDIIGFGDANIYRPINQQLWLLKGDTIDFIVMPRSSFFDDVTLIEATVELVSER